VDGAPYKLPATIDDPAILAEIANALNCRGLPAPVAVRPEPAPD
jgi:hypothetical protein